MMSQFHIHQWRTLLLGLCIAGVMWLPGKVSAQNTDAAMENLLRDANLEGKAADSSPVPKSSVSEVNRLVHWRLWKRVVASGEKPGVDELTALEHDGRSVGFVNQLSFAAAVSALASTQPDYELGIEMFMAAERLAPDLPYIDFAKSQYVFDRDIGRIDAWSSAWTSAMRKALKWPDVAFPWALKLLLFGLVAFFSAAFIFVCGQMIRQFGVVSYDAARFLPAGFSSNQTVILLLAAVVVPALLLQSPLVGLLVLIALISVPQRLWERAITIAIFGMMAALPKLDTLIVDLASYAGSDAQVLTHAQYVYCGAPCREDLVGRQEHRPDDMYILFTQLLAGYRTGEVADLEAIVETVPTKDWPKDLAGHANNLAGAAHLALGNPNEALTVLERAKHLIPNSGAPSFNMMRAYQMTDDINAASSALQDATSRDLPKVSRQLGFERRDVNAFIMAEPLPLEAFLQYHRQSKRTRTSAIMPVWRALAGPEVELDQATTMGLGGLLFALLFLPFAWRSKTSTPCPKCGMARDPEDSPQTGHHRYCLPCYRTFVTGAGMDYNARVYNETVLGRREQMMDLLRRVSSIGLPGMGHHIAGRSLSGFFVSFSLIIGIILIAAPLGVVRPAHELFSANWGGPVTVGWILVSLAASIALYGAIRDIAPVNAAGVN